MLLSDQSLRSSCHVGVCNTVNNKYLLTTELIMRFFILFLTFLPLLVDVTLADVYDYEEFLPFDEPNESLWTLDDSVTATDLYSLDAGQIEYPFELYDQELPQDIASIDLGCSSGGIQALDRLRPRGGDEEFCRSNLGPQERPLIIPNLATMDLELLCPNMFGELASHLVCASKIPGNVQTSSVYGTTLLECEAGMFLPFSES